MSRVASGMRAALRLLGAVPSYSPTQTAATRPIVDLNHSPPRFITTNSGCDSNAIMRKRFKPSADVSHKRAWSQRWQAESRLSDECSTPNSQRETPKVDDSDRLSDSSSHSLDSSWTPVFEREQPDIAHGEWPTSPLGPCTPTQKDLETDWSASPQSTPGSSPRSQARLQADVAPPVLSLVLKSSAGSDRKLPSCGTKRPASFLNERSSSFCSTTEPPPPFPGRSADRVSRLGWDLPKVVEPNYVMRKLDKFLRRTGRCEKLDKGTAYEISGTYKVKRADTTIPVQGCCRFQLNLFRLIDDGSKFDSHNPSSSSQHHPTIKAEPEANKVNTTPETFIFSAGSKAASNVLKTVGTHVQIMRVLGDTFVYQNLVRKVGQCLTAMVRRQLTRA
jgi:hypothetical protein